jgi:hypothetical protein
VAEAIPPEVRLKGSAKNKRCNTATELTKENWKYIKVPQKDFEKLHPESFEELIDVLNRPTVYD